VSVKSFKMLIKKETTLRGMVGSDSSFKSQKAYKKPSSMRIHLRFKLLL